MEVRSFSKHEVIGESGMTKHDLLEYLADAGRADAMDVATTCGVTYAAAAMAILRLARQGLVRRYVDADDGLYFYELSERGHARLEFFRTHH
jgi:DNA-binding MarR family transcriptional regulator